MSTTSKALWKTLRTATLVAGLSLAAPFLTAQETATVPVGYMTLEIQPGTGTTKVITPLSLPLYGFAEIDGQAKGTITSFTNSTISNSNAGWTPNQLSNEATPYLIKLTSGNATGRILLIDTTTQNTATMVTIHPDDIAQGNLTSLGVAIGDQYEILPCDTLSSLFGTPATSGILGGTAVKAADTVLINVNGRMSTYFFHTGLNRWSRSALGSPNASNVTIHPDNGILYQRLGNSNLTLTLQGRIPFSNRLTTVKNSGSTLLSQNWPLPISLIDTNFHHIPSWITSATVNAADTVQVTTNGTAVNYWHDGTNWRKQEINSPIADNDLIPAGAAVLINKKGSTTGYAPLNQQAPYNIE